jgi:hypothetical protein
MTGGEIFLVIVLIIAVGILVENHQNITMARNGMEQKVVSVNGEETKIWVKYSQDNNALEKD